MSPQRGVIAPQKIIAPYFGIITNEPTNLCKLTKCQYRVVPYIASTAALKKTTGLI